MRERPIIFNREMVHAVMEGRKVQTRRIIKLDHERGMQNPVVRGKSGAVSYVGCRLAANLCPFGAVGDRLWVRETWQCTSFETNEYGHVEAVDYMRQISVIKPNSLAWGVSYKADGFESDDADERGFPWRPSIHMPRWASRITLEITGVRVERLHAITLGDICKEIGCGLYDFKPATYGFQVWEELWQSIYREESWLANPWVWVIEFKRVEGE